MAGLLDFLGSDEARLGLGLLAAGAPQTDPSKTGIGFAFQSALADVDAAKKAKLQLKYIESQALENESQAAARNLTAQRQADMDRFVASRLMRDPTTNADGAGTTSAATSNARPGAGNFPFSLDDLTFLAASGHKGAGDLLKTYQVATEGVKREPGAIYEVPGRGVVAGPPKLPEGMTIGPNGEVVPAANFGNVSATLAAQKTEAEARARASVEPETYYDPVSRTNVRGTRQLPPPQFGAPGGGGTQPPVVAPAVAPTGPMGSRIRPQDPPGFAGGSPAAAAGIQVEALLPELTKAQARLNAATAAGDTQEAARAQADLAGIQRELVRVPGGAQALASASRPGGAPAGPVAPAVGPTPPVAPPMAPAAVAGPQPPPGTRFTEAPPEVQQQLKAREAYGNAEALNFQKRAEAIRTSAFNSNTRIAELNRINQLLTDFEGGKFAKSKLSLAQAANSLGVRVDAKLGDKEAADALTNSFALGKRDPSEGAGMPGALSNSDRDFLRQMSPGIEQSAAGRKTLIETNLALEQRNQEVARFAANYAKANGGVIDQGFYDQLSAWSDKHPLFKGK